MDFGVVGLDHHHHHHNPHQHHHNNSLHNGLGVSSSSSEVGFASSNVISSSSSPDPETKPRTLLYGSELSSSQGKPEKSSGSGLEDYWRSSKVAKTGSDDDFSSAFQQRNNNNNNCGSLMRSSNNSSNNGNNSNTTTSTTTLSFLDNNNNNGGYNSHSQHHQMLSFSSSSSSPTKSEAHTLPYFSNALPASYTARSTGYNMYHQQQQGGGMMRSGPFTASQWMELEHQALIYKCITSAVPIPSNLLIPIRKAFDSAFPPSLLRSNPLGGGWGSAFHFGFSNNADLEPERCRRTDGKKWRCSRDAVADQKYCERHMNRGRHRSRKPVEGPAAAALAVKTDAANNNHNHATKATAAPSNRMFGKEAREFGAVSSVVDTNSLHQFIDSWPERTQLSISIPGGGGGVETNLSPLRLSNSTGGEGGNWMSSSLGGPLGEALNLMPDGTSPTGVLQKPAYGSLSNSSAGSSPTRVDVHTSSLLLPPAL